jgi:Ca2+-binding RTX toxin-like protein
MVAALAWDVRIGSIGITGATPPIYGTLGIAALPGPDSLRVQWGGTDPTGTYPDTTWHAPLTSLPFPFFLPPQFVGSFIAPGFFESRPYADGSYAIRVTGFFGDGSRQVEWLTAFFDVNGTAGVYRGFSGRDDLAYGGSGNDTFFGAGGDDWMFGGLGDDLLVGGAGNDALSGGPNDATGADTLLGGDGFDVLDGNGGNDLLRGGTGHDIIYGNEGNDSLFGDDGDDVVGGDEGDDRLVGGTGADTFIGGNGSDTAISAADGAADWFLFTSELDGLDRIVGFEDGVDFLVASDLSDPEVGGVVASAGEMTDTSIWFIYNSGNGRLWVDVNGTDVGGLHALAILVGAPTITRDDFLFAEALII